MKPLFNRIGKNFFNVKPITYRNYLISKHSLKYFTSKIIDAEESLKTLQSIRNNNNSKDIESYNNHENIPDKIKQQENLKEYNLSLNKHFNFDYQFTDLEYYYELYTSIARIKESSKIEDGLMILNDLIVFQLNYLLENNQSFLINILELLSEHKLGTYKMYFLVEEEFIKNLPTYASEFIVRMAYAFVLNDQGSKYFYNKIADEILKRKISNLSDKEFLFIYNTMSLVSLDNKMFWLIANRANKELFKIDEELLLKPTLNN